MRYTTIEFLIGYKLTVEIFTSRDVRRDIVSRYERREDIVLRFASRYSHRAIRIEICFSSYVRRVVSVVRFASRYSRRDIYRDICVDIFPSWNLRRDISFGRIASIYSLKIFASRGDRCEICLERSASRDSRRHMFSRFVASTGDLRREISIEIFSARIA